MSANRFAVFLVALAVAVAAGAFVTGLAVLDDGQPDPPPRADGTATTSTTAAAPAPTAAPPATTAPGPVAAPTDELATPTWIVVVASKSAPSDAQDAAEAVAALGYPAGVLRSDDYPSLAPGFWVAYAGPYESRRSAEAAHDDLDESGLEGGYVRCAGSVKDCERDRDKSEDD